MELKIRSSFFNNKANLFITLLGFSLLLWVAIPFIDWAFLKATWVGESRLACGQGACWAMIHARFKQFIYGFYPSAEYWRINCAFGLLVVSLVLLSITQLKIIVRIIALVCLWAMIVYLLHGGGPLVVVPTSAWGGLFLTIFLAVGSILCAFPIGLLLALGRHSSLLCIKGFCVLFIEVIRGVPLITILFMASVMLPMFFSYELDVDKLFRAFVGLTIFQSAYLAEVIRSGLNAIPKGQFDAAHSLGMSYMSTMWFIVLPQALRIVIPGLVNNFIALFKDTTLVLMIGIFDFLGIVQTAITDPRWLGTSLEGYLFCAVVYWIICFSMSSYSQYLEKKLPLRIQ